MSDVTFKNVFAENDRQKIPKCQMSDANTEGRHLVTNGVYIACSWCGLNSQLRIMDIGMNEDAKVEAPIIEQNRQPISDLEFSPFYQEIIATGSEDGKIRLFKIPEGGLKERMNTPEMEVAFKRKVCLINFNPVASNLLSAISYDQKVHLIDCVKGQGFSEIPVKGNSASLVWNVNGSVLGMTNKSKELVLLDPREKKETVRMKVTEGIRPSKICWSDTNTVVSLGWGLSGAKELKLFDIRKAQEDLTVNFIQKIQIDTMASVTVPYCDRESKCIFTLGRGESTLKGFYFDGKEYKKGLDSKLNDPCLELAWVPRRFVDYENCIIDRFIYFSSVSKTINFASVKVPRKNPCYDPEIYPPVFCGEPAMTVEEWVGGATKDPVTKEIDQIEAKFVGAPVCEKKKEEKKEEHEGVKYVVDDAKIKDLEVKVMGLERKIKTLEEENEKLRAELKEAKAKIPAEEPPKEEEAKEE